MKLSTGDIIKNLRREMGLNQEDFAEKINRSTRWLSRVESDKADVHMTELVDIMAKFGKSMNESSMFVLPNKERQSFQAYSALMNCFKLYGWDGFDTAVAELRNGATKEIHTSFIDFHVEYARIYRKVTARNPQFEEYNADDFVEMEKAMEAAIDGFHEDDVEDYLITPRELYMLCNMSYALFVMGEPKRSLELVKKALNSKSLQARQKNNSSDAIYLRTVQAVLDSYIDNDMYEDALAEALKLLYRMIKAKDLRNIPNCLNLVSAAYAGLGEWEDIFKSYVLRAYHWAVLTGVQINIDFFCNKCEENNIDINYMPSQPNPHV